MLVAMFYLILSLSLCHNISGWVDRVDNVDNVDNSDSDGDK